MAPLGGRVLIARTLARIGYRGLIDRDSIYFTVIERIPGKDGVLVREVVIDAPLHEVFVGGLLSRKQVFADTTCEGSAVRRREKREVWSDLWVQRHLASIDDAVARIGVRNKCRAADSQTFDQSLVGEKVKRFVARDRTAQRRAKLISFKWRNRFGLGIEKILGI